MAITIRPASLFRRSGILLVVASLAAFGSLLTMPRPVAACSCVALTSWKEAINADTAVFSGTAGQREGRGVPVRVERWFQGREAAPIVWLTAGSFNGNPGVSNSCGVEAPPPGSSWLWVAYRGENGDLSTGLCSPAGDLDTPEGQAMLAEALTIFGEISVPAASQAQTAEPPGAASTPDPAAAARDQAAVTIIGGLLAGSLALFGALILVARRSRKGTNLSG